MALIASTSRQHVKGGEIAARMLAAEHVEHVFGIIDGTYFGFYSKLAENGIRLVSPRHETCAAHMAGAYARSTGKLGVCIASNGPGVANILPGIAVENAEGNRVLLITSCRRTGISYPDRGGTFQYFPHVEVIKSMAKWSCVVPAADRLAEILRRALRTCFMGRPGVVHVDVPENIMNGTFDSDDAWFRAPETYRAELPHPSPAAVAAAAAMLAEARRPLLHAGSGVLHGDAGRELAALAALLEAPITTSWGGRSAVDERARHAVPMIYVEAVNEARRGADVVLAVGTRMGETDWWGKPPYWGDPRQQRLIHVDLEPDPLGANRPADLAIQADARSFLVALLERLQALNPPAAMPERRAFVERLGAACRARRQKLDSALSDTSVPMCSAHVAGICQEVFGDDAILVVDGGNTSIWAQFYHEVRAPRSVLTTFKMGMLGAGIGQALGAKVAHPARTVYCIIGDGAMAMHCQEIETAVRDGLDVIFLVLCDKQWGMVKMNQQFALRPLKTLLLRSLGPDETINTDFREIEFDKLGRALGAYAERVGDPQALRGALARCLRAGRCAVVHVDVDPVKHLWAPNLRDFKAMHEEPGR
ncbi:MAG: thiamine pyrophosphate-binding protein [Candidatus Schekmanbacteria bacterium]|nr:thiamine pyrophosphate-binding protein [Candidatus Schekmanbacteria bacterium]